MLEPGPFTGAPLGLGTPTFAATDSSATSADLGAAQIYVFTATGITFTISSADITDNRRFIFSDESGLPSVGTPITVTTEGTETIDGGSSALIRVPFGSLHLYARGGNLFSI